MDFKQLKLSGENTVYIKIATKMYTLSNCRTFLFIVQDALSKLYKKLFNDRKLLKFSKIIFWQLLL